VARPDRHHSLPDPSNSKGYPDRLRQIQKYQFGTGKAKRILGLQEGRFMKEETAKDILKYFEERGCYLSKVLIVVPINYIRPVLHTTNYQTVTLNPDAELSHRMSPQKKKKHCGASVAKTVKVAWQWLPICRATLARRDASRKNS
jgi:hypothetical protein